MKKVLFFNPLLLKEDFVKGVKKRLTYDKKKVLLLKELLTKTNSELILIWFSLQDEKDLELIPFLKEVNIIPIDYISCDDINIYDPETNIRIGCWYLNTLYKEFGKTDLVIVAYNGGSGNVKKWLSDREYSYDGENLRIIPFSETDSYLQKVKKNYEQYNKLYSKEGRN